METKPLAFGIAGFLLGGLVVSVAATQLSANTTEGSSMHQMTKQLEGKTGDDYDRAFITSMIEHHESAVDMARLSKNRAKHDEIKALSNDIIKSQGSEINQMKAWQKDWGYDSSKHSSH